ncbi:MAG: amidohydrolase [Cryobacterium sp.]|nr:amidohydrolase [Cryobacterium sp.]
MRQPGRPRPRESCRHACSALLDSCRPVAFLMGEISGITVWDGHTDRGVSRLSWDGDNILGLEPAPDADDSLAEYSIIPGLVDTHVHLGAYSGSRSVDWSTWPLITPAEERVFHIAANAQLAARYGVTTLRDLGGDATHLAVSRVFEEGIQASPRLIVHGQVGMTAGHGDQFVPPHYPDRPPVADSPDECRKLVRQWARSGAHGPARRHRRCGRRHRARRTGRHPRRRVRRRLRGAARPPGHQPRRSAHRQHRRRALPRPAGVRRTARHPRPALAPQSPAPPVRPQHAHVRSPHPAPRT